MSAKEAQARIKINKLLEIQKQIVAELEEDLATVEGAKRLKAKMEANIRATIGRVGGEKV